MARPVFHLHPKARRYLSDLGSRISLARERRSMTRKLLAQRAGITEFTLRRVESGEIGVTIGAYLAALYALGLAADLETVAAADPLGRDLQDASLMQRPRRAAKPVTKPDSSNSESNPLAISAQSRESEAVSDAPEVDPKGGQPPAHGLDQTATVTSADILAYLLKQQK